MFTDIYQNRLINKDYLENQNYNCDNRRNRSKSVEEITKKTKEENKEGTILNEEKKVESNNKEKEKSNSKANKSLKNSSTINSNNNSNNLNSNYFTIDTSKANQKSNRKKLSKSKKIKQIIKNFNEKIIYLRPYYNTPF